MILVNYLQVFRYIIELEISINRYKFAKLIFCFWIILHFINCGYNHEPIIQSLIADPEVVEPGGIVILTCNASDDEGLDSFKNDQLTYTWDATAGNILEDSGGSTASWTAPLQSGIYAISCIVEDPNYGTDIAMINITVE